MTLTMNAPLTDPRAAGDRLRAALTALLVMSASDDRRPGDPRPRTGARGADRLPPPTTAARPDPVPGEPVDTSFADPGPYAEDPSDPSTR
ncbi:MULTISPECIES: hypothetical protein [Saccharopolyspora]|uniref:Uncharacterized protein n=1 Tax=Saccharopolyspora cebuensis TaxID=418759 RepID=A0ABV4CLI8_9PSEU